MVTKCATKKSTKPASKSRSKRSASKGKRRSGKRSASKGKGRGGKRSASRSKSRSGKRKRCSSKTTTKSGKRSKSQPKCIRKAKELSSTEAHTTKSGKVVRRPIAKEMHKHGAPIGTSIRSGGSKYTLARSTRGKYYWRYDISQ